MDLVIPAYCTSRYRQITYIDLSALARPSLSHPKMYVVQSNHASQWAHYNLELRVGVKEDPIEPWYPLCAIEATVTGS